MFDSNGASSASPKAPARAYVLMVAAGVTLSVLIGAAAALLHDGGARFGAALAAVLLGPCLSLAWLVFVSGHTAVPDRHAADNAESRWITEASSSALVDLVVAAGIGLVLLAVTGAQPSAVGLLTGVVVLAIADTAVRFAVAKRRAS